ncbi:MAG: tetratricopeptide repeat protein [Prevotellaceae bacterium]|jgi:tetratricopeptide (TPR) repeat protein|nr:tetratricopeptide repeat protein [Prevotellaceae bacterium]
MMRNIFLLIFLSVSALVFSQNEVQHIRTGNDLFRQNKFAEADREYVKALKINDKSFEANFNLGNSLYRQGKYDLAVKQFSKASTLADSEREKKRIAAAWYNIGNTYFQSKDTLQNKPEEYGKMLKNSIEAYKNSLKNDPSDGDTRYNLAMAQTLLSIKKQQQNEQQQQQEEDDKISEENAQQLLNALMLDEQQAQQNRQKPSKINRRQPENDW